MAEFELKDGLAVLATGGVQEVKRWENGRAVGPLLDEKTGNQVYRVGVLVTINGKVAEQAVQVPLKEAPKLEALTKLLLVGPSISVRDFGEASYTLKARGLTQQAQPTQGGQQ
nr:unnamed protein product [uncultured bacterium]